MLILSEALSASGLTGIYAYRRISILGGHSVSEYYSSVHSWYMCQVVEFIPRSSNTICWVRNFNSSLLGVTVPPRLDSSAYPDLFHSYLPEIFQPWQEWKVVPYLSLQNTLPLLNSWPWWKARGPWMKAVVLELGWCRFKCQLNHLLILWSWTPASLMKSTFSCKTEEIPTPMGNFGDVERTCAW